MSLAQLGVAYLESNKHNKAITAFHKALKIRWLCYGNRHPKVAKILNNIGCALYEIDELEVAKVALEESLHIQRYLLQSLPVNSMVNSQTQLLSIASTQSNIASIKLYHGEFDEALVDLEEALLVQQCVLSDDHPIVKRTEESIVWVEKSRNVATGRSSGELDLVSRLTGFGSMLSTGSLPSTGSCDNELTLCRGKDDEPSLSVFNLLERRLMELHANLDIACGGDGGNTVFENDDDISSAPSSSGPQLSKKYSLYLARLDSLDLFQRFAGMEVNDSFLSTDRSAPPTRSWRLIDDKDQASCIFHWLHQHDLKWANNGPVKRSPGDQHENKHERV